MPPTLEVWKSNNYESVEERERGGVNWLTRNSFSSAVHDLISGTMLTLYWSIQFRCACIGMLHGIRLAESSIYSIFLSKLLHAFYWNGSTFNKNKGWLKPMLFWGNRILPHSLHCFEKIKLDRFTRLTEVTEHNQRLVLIFINAIHIKYLRQLMSLWEDLWKI